MTRTEYELVFQAFKNYRLYMTDEQEVLSEKILDNLFYPSFDELSKDHNLYSQEIETDNTVKSLNFR